MTENTLNLLIVLGVIGIISTLIYLLDRRTRTKGALFTANPGRGLRVLAIVIGGFFILISVVTFLAYSAFNPSFVIVGIALLGYGIGSGVKQSASQSTNQPPIPASLADSKNEPVIESFENKPQIPGRFVPFLKTYSLILLGSILVIAISFWVSTHPNNQLSRVILIGGIIILGFILMILTKVIDIIKLSKMK